MIGISNDAYCQLFETQGKVVNVGTIKVKNRQLKQTGGRIENDSGQIIIDAPTTVFAQDTLLGRIDYIFDKGISNHQYVPQITYWDVRFAGNSYKKLTDTTRILTSLSRFVSDTVVHIDMNDKTHINAKGYITHNGYVNLGKSTGLINMDGVLPQDIDGVGTFKELALDNFKGADVINYGGFRVNTTLELIKGQFRNNDTNNFTMGNDSKIIRHSGASISSAPIFEGNVSVHYVGDSLMYTGPELPDDTTKLQDLYVDNVDGIILTKDVTANRDIKVGTLIKTEEDNDNRHILTSTASQDPIFITPNSEIIGSFRRTNLKYNNEKILFNNKYTYILFANEADANGIAEMTMRIIPKMLPPNGDISSKVQRDIYISARDSNYAPISSAIRFELGYAWRKTNDSKDETGSLPITELILQRWNGNDWDDNQSSEKPPIIDNDGWAYSRATTVTQLGQFAIGITLQGQLFVKAKVFLEGPYRWGSMTTDLLKQGLIPKSPPDVYPHNVDPQRNLVRFDSLPENTVDWVMLEFDDVDSSDIKFYKHCLLLSDGTIVDSNGNSIKVPERGRYKIIIRHRNHLAVMTKDTIEVYPGIDEQLIDFTNLATVTNFNGSSLKMLDQKDDGSFIFGLYAGDVNADGIINDFDLSNDLSDYNLTWENRNITGYSIYDLTLSGIIHTRDLNITWNNRNKQSDVSKAQ